MINYPNYQWQKDTYNVGQFNNILSNGFSQGLSLYSPEQDVKLFQYIDYDPINPNKINFDKLNDELNNKTYYDKGKSMVQGVVDQLNTASNETEKNIKNSFTEVVNKMGDNIKFIFAAAILFLLLNKK